jgi:protein-disulfide isomerase
MQEKSNNLLIPISIIIAGGLVFWGIVSNQKKPEQTEGSTTTISEIQETEGAQTTSTDTVGVLETDYILGNPDADLILITFSDFECSFCKIFHQTMNQIVDEYSKDGRVAWVFRQFPIHGVTAEEKAAAARCAGQLGGNSKFWGMSDKIFQTEFSQEKSFVTEQLVELARSIEIEEKDFLTCLDNKTTMTSVLQEYQTGVEAGVLGKSGTTGGTPHTIILTRMGKTYPINGAQPYSVVKSIIDIILQGQ